MGTKDNLFSPGLDDILCLKNRSTWAKNSSCRSQAQVAWGDDTSSLSNQWPITSITSNTWSKMISHCTVTRLLVQLSNTKQNRSLLFTSEQTGFHHFVDSTYLTLVKDQNSSLFDFKRLNLTRINTFGSKTLELPASWILHGHCWSPFAPKCFSHIYSLSLKTRATNRLDIICSLTFLIPSLVHSWDMRS